MVELTAVYMAAGLSSRFGGRAKGLAKVGPNNESFMAMSMKEAVAAGFDRFVLIVSDKTVDLFKAEFGDFFEGKPVEYAFQKTPEWREKPFGTTHAILAVKGLVHGPFMALNSDDLYGVATMKLIAANLSEGSDSYCIPGYKLKNVVPENGTVNRGFINVDGGNLTSIDETFDILKSDLSGKFSPDQPISMNIFGFQPEFLDYAEKDFEKFKEALGDDKKKECLIVDTITNFIKDTGAKFSVVPTDDTWIGMTNPEDEDIVRDLLAKA